MTAANLSEILDGPPRHLERWAPPWSTDRRTICGRPLTDVAAWLTWDDGRALVAKLGAQRARLILCQTCLSQERSAQRRESWDATPAQIVYDYAQHGTYGAAKEQTGAELRALARLAELHADEYHALVASYLSDDLADRRAKRGRR